MDWFVDRDNGNVLFVKGVDDLNDLTEDQLYKFGITDINKYDRFGHDNMFGKEVG